MENAVQDGSLIYIEVGNLIYSMGATDQNVNMHYRYI